MLLWPDVGVRARCKEEDARRKSGTQNAGPKTKSDSRQHWRQDIKSADSQQKIRYAGYISIPSNADYSHFSLLSSTMFIGPA